MTRAVKVFLIFFVFLASLHAEEGLPLFWYKEPGLLNFGDVLSAKIVERIVGRKVPDYSKITMKGRQKLLGLGSIFYFAETGDVVWGSGINGKTLRKDYYQFTDLDIRAVRGPLSRQFLIENFGIEVPEVYGDPALLIPYLFPEFQKKENPKYEYLIIPHYRVKHIYPKTPEGNVIYPTDPWEEIIEKITDSKLVITHSLHGVIVAEAFGIPARLLPPPVGEFPFKYQDYYAGTGRMHYQVASSVEEAIEMGGEPLPVFDAEKLFKAFPFDYWPTANFFIPDFSKDDRVK